MEVYNAPNTHSLADGLARRLALFRIESGTDGATDRYADGDADAHVSECRTEGNAKADTNSNPFSRVSSLHYH